MFQIYFSSLFYPGYSGSRFLQSVGIHPRNGQVNSPDDSDLFLVVKVTASDSVAVVRH
jgi:hypothetical protein